MTSGESGQQEARPVDGVVLAGGAGTRLGGVSKPDLDVAGVRLLDRVLAAVAGCRRIVVVAPYSVAVPAGVLRTLEDPPGGGPVAGIAAGVEALPDACDGAVLVLACDLPGVIAAVPALLRAAGRPGAPGDGAIAVDGTGHRQNLVFVAERGALETALGRGGARDRSARSLLTELALEEVAIAGDAIEDIDT